MGSKSLQPDQNERIRRELRAWIDKEHAGNDKAAAKALGISQSLVSEFLAGGRGAGPKLINAFATHAGRSIDDLYGRPPVGSKILRLGDRTDWPMARNEAFDRAPQRRLTRADVERVAGVMLDDPPAALSGEAVLRLAEALLYVPSAVAKAS